MYIIASISIVIILLLYIYIVIHKNEKIITDSGYIRFKFILIGMLSYFFSLYFNIFSSYSSCSLNLFFKHCGILLIYSMFLTYISAGYRLGMDNKKLERLNLSMFQSDKSLNSSHDNENTKINNNEIKKENYVSTTINDQVVFNIKKELNSFNKNTDNIDNINKLSKNGSKLSVKNNKKENDTVIMKKLNKSISYIHSLYIEIIILYIITVIIIIFSIIIFSNTTKKYIQEFDGKWRYQCSLYRFDIILNLIELLLVFYLLVLSIKIWNYTFIFKCTKFIGYSNIIWMVLGPLANV